jgi:hypothetical protein
MGDKGIVENNILEFPGLQLGGRNPTVSAAGGVNL